MKFSIICTNYNKDPYIGICIESVLSQDIQDFEFIIIDDASTDLSVNIIQSFVKQYPDKIIFIQNPINIGMAAGYNKAFAVASGEIICLIDSDDFWFPGKLALVDRTFKENKSCVLHQHLLQVYHFSEPLDEVYRPYLVTGDLLKYMQETNEIPLFVPTTGLSFRMQALRNVLPIPSTFAKNGEAFITRTIICHGQVVTSLSVLGAYRKTDSNLVFGNNSWDSFSYIEGILKPALNEFYRQNNINLFFPPTNVSVNKSYFKKYLQSIRKQFNNILSKNI